MDHRQAFQDIAARALEGELAFPTGARAALALKKELDNPQSHLDEAIGWIEAEPLLAARVVGLANSAAYNRSGFQASNPRAAAMRLGFKTLRTLAARHLASQLTMDSDPRLQAKADQLWARAAQVAALARMLAKNFGQDPEDALFVGLVQDLGGFYLISQAPRHPGLLDEPLEGWAGEGEALVGQSVLRAVGAPEAAIAAASDAWLGMGSSPPKTLGDILCLANALAPNPSPLAPPGGWSRDWLGSRSRLDLAGEPLAQALGGSSRVVVSLDAALVA